MSKRITFKTQHNGWGISSVGLIILLSTLIFTACKSEESTAKKPQAHTPSEASSTALSSNQVEDDFTFDQFQQKNISIDLAEKASDLWGDYYVVKLYDNDQTYYLGTSDQLTVLKLQISMPRHVTKLWLEVFTNKYQAGSVTEEIML